MRGVDAYGGDTGNMPCQSEEQAINLMKNTVTTSDVCGTYNSKTKKFYLKQIKKKPKLEPDVNCITWLMGTPI